MGAIDSSYLRTVYSLPATVALIGTVIATALLNTILRATAGSERTVLQVEASGWGRGRALG
eukprot:3808249-Rhodomonas_salina.1